MRLLVVDRNPDLQFPPHPGAQAMYHFLRESAMIFVDGDTFDAAPGETTPVFLAAKPQ